ncbi:hypothetical protein FKM82_019496 [Ascaphus truei]
MLNTEETDLLQHCTRMSIRYKQQNDLAVDSMLFCNEE